MRTERGVTVAFGRERKLGRYGGNSQPYIIGCPPAARIAQRRFQQFDDPAHHLAGTLRLAAIVTVTQSGATARSVAARRPLAPILAATPDAAVARSLAGVCGVQPIVIDAYDTTDELVSAAVRAAVLSGVASAGEMVAVTGGVAVHVAGSTDFVQVCTV